MKSRKSDVGLPRDASNLLKHERVKRLLVALEIKALRPKELPAITGYSYKVGAERLRDLVLAGLVVKTLNEEGKKAYAASEKGRLELRKRGVRGRIEVVVLEDKKRWF